MATRPEKSSKLFGNAVRLTPEPCEKPWGRIMLGPWGLELGNGRQPIGEVHHRVAAGDPPLLIKTLFTGEPLSVQVHPDQAGAQARGHRRGKDEAWVVLAAEPGARIGKGLVRDGDAATLRAAAHDGTIMDMLHWHDCAAGDVFFTPAGTIHAIGAGVTLFEIQQNCDLTYRLFDHGRDRPLHLDDGLAVADMRAWAPPQPLPSPGPGRELLVAGPSFVLERIVTAGGQVVPPVGRILWLAVVSGSGHIGADRLAAGEVWEITAPVHLGGQAEFLLAYTGADPVADLWMED
ncbi:class I mannose-6-phosphate isomerase [Sandarakinorhabdus sp. DWP1-3-1]|uniref:class I mannose-6-phosphate isomerase n=1 Tax=Sandarakinorhabdus sp. DWP1-3-1 TaxID=2804627 RepID=UPI003CE73FB0